MNLRKSDERHWRLLLLVLVAVGCVGGALLLSLAPPLQNFQYQQEWVSALLQAGLVAAAGIVVSAVGDRIRDNIQQQRDLGKLRYDVLAGLSRTYMDVKLVRR